MSVLLAAVLPLLDKILDMIPDPEAKAKAHRELTLSLVQIEADQKLNQVALNKQEAKHASIFVAGWRPFIGWIGGFALAWTFVLHPIVTWLALVNGYTGLLPELETSELMTLVVGMLGLGAMRSFDKLKGNETSQVTVLPKRKPLNE